MQVSFVVPAFNEEVLLGRSLAALVAEIARTGCEAEIVVVNNASTDRTREVALAVPGVRVVDEPMKGLVQARRAGFAATTGKLVANIDADTVLTEGWLARAVAAFDRGPALVALSGPYVYYDLPASQRLVVAAFYRVSYLFYLANRLLRLGSMMQGGNFIVRRSALEAVGGFNPAFRFYGEDTDLARRLSKAGSVRFCFRQRALSSGRRLARQGVMRVGWDYSMNFLWATFRRRPWTEEWVDVRPEPPETLADVPV